MGFLRMIRDQRRQWRASPILLFIFVIGCSQGPKAPPLEDGPVFYDRQEGFRFLVPDGWKQSVHALVPPGRLEDERIIVEYHLPTEKAASFAVTCADINPSLKLDDYVATHVPGGAHWKLTGPGQPCRIQDVPAERMMLTGHPQGPEPYTREVLAFRRGDRVYFFTGIFATSDKAAAEQVHQTNESIIW